MSRQKQIIEEWDAGSDDYFGKVDYDRFFLELKGNPYRGFPKTMEEMIRTCAPNLEGKRICVPSCGDSLAAFSFCALGAEVTACDISSKQIENAHRIACNRKMPVTYCLSDTMKLTELQDEVFDMVYTSNGVHVWIHDLPAMYENIRRLLKRGGHYIFFDTHPFSRPFDTSGEGDVFRIIKRYEDVGPFENDPTFDWRIQDYVNALVSSGLAIRRMEEFHSVPEDDPKCNYLYDAHDIRGDRFDWRKNPWAALPQCVGFCCQKE